MTFLWPTMLWLLLAIPALLAGYLLLLRRRSQPALRFPHLGLIREALGKGPGWRRHLPPALMLLSVAAALFAAARPVATITLPADQQTLLLAIDVSLSMRAEDIEPNRMEAAQAAARSFVRELPGKVRVGIVAFAGTASLVQAPTRDREALLAAIDGFQLQRATAVGSGILVSLASLFPDAAIDLEESLFGNRAGAGARSPAAAPGGARSDASPSAPVQPGSSGSAAIVLLTDGRTTTGPDPLEAARTAAAMGVRVHTVGFGSGEGATVAFNGFSMFMRFDEEALRAIAQITGGEYYHAASGDDLQRIYRELGARFALETARTEIGALFAALAAALALAAAGLSFAWFRAGR
ncbi:VWA domain-containing protein [Quisquiliibacterium transsilvanicum]|uniref:Ca-activated chloride channel family protein n=1 Tax=Quisquiliibacterium transsilvanicum TaxID=1549638 RepID=A0A7W8MB06_9BURK|nr:VWA domain-containing protein [Quisquiliibacterium transsilvanicum]MBB5273659.1 Ca-activated chloride channel family protein [Quisquiliibacterium transsilvanicum]